MQIQIGLVWISVPWCASNALGSTETWVPTCPGSAPWTWTTGRWSWAWLWRPSVTRWPTACGRQLWRTTTSQEATAPGKVLPNEVCGDYRRRKHRLLSISCHLLATPHFNRCSSHFKTLHKNHQGSINVIVLSWLNFSTSFILFYGHLPVLICSKSLFHVCIWLENHPSCERCHIWHDFAQI